MSDPKISASILAEGVAKWRRRTYPNKASTADVKRSQMRGAAASASGEARDTSGKHHFGRSWDAVDKDRESKSDKQARHVAHNQKRGIKKSGKKPGYKMVFGSWIKEDEQVSASILREGSQSWSKLSGKLRAGKPGAMARADRKQGKASGRPNPVGTFVRTGRDSGYNEVDQRQAAHKARRGKKTKAEDTDALIAFIVEWAEAAVGGPTLLQEKMRTDIYDGHFDAKEKKAISTLFFKAAQQVQHAHFELKNRLPNHTWPVQLSKHLQSFLTAFMDRGDVNTANEYVEKMRKVLGRKAEIPKRTKKAQDRKQAAWMDREDY